MLKRITTNKKNIFSNKQSQQGIVPDLDDKT